MNRITILALFLSVVFWPCMGLTRSPVIYDYLDHAPIPSNVGGFVFSTPFGSGDEMQASVHLDESSIESKTVDFELVGLSHDQKSRWLLKPKGWKEGLVYFVRLPNYKAWKFSVGPALHKGPILPLKITPVPPLALVDSEAPQNSDPRVLLSVEVDQWPPFELLEPSIEIDGEKMPFEWERQGWTDAGAEVRTFCDIGFAPEGTVDAGVHQIRITAKMLGGGDFESTTEDVELSCPRFSARGHGWIALLVGFGVLIGLGSLVKR